MSSLCIYVTEKFKMNSCIGVGEVQGCRMPNRDKNMAITGEFLSVELIYSPGQLNGKLKSLQQNGVLQLSERGNLLFQLKALNEQFEQRNKRFEVGKFQWNLLRDTKSQLKIFSVEMGSCCNRSTDYKMTKSVPLRSSMRKGSSISRLTIKLPVAMQWGTTIPSIKCFWSPMKHRRRS